MRFRYLPHLKVVPCRLALLLFASSPWAGEPSQSIDHVVGGPEYGDAAAIYRLARAYIVGSGVPKDAQKAYDLMGMAADQGYPDAIGGIGFFYGTGLIVTKDASAAAEWFKKGAEKDGPRSQVNYARALIAGRGVPKDEAEGLKWLDKALVRGVPEAHFMKGEFYYRGEHGHPQDYVKAREYLQKAASADHAPAQNMLGTIYEQGLGVGIDLEQARHWYRMAAEQGDAKAQSNLGQLLGPDGRDASKHVEALKWLLLASRTNEPMACNLINEILPRVPEAEKADAQRQAAAFRPRAPAGDGK